MEEKLKLEAEVKGGNSKRLAVLETAVVTGVLASQEQAQDVKIINFSMSLYGKMFIDDTKLELNFGRRYGLIGQNGSGKTTMLAAIAAREIPIPESIDMWFLDKEAEPSDMTAVEAVTYEAKKEFKRLEDLTM